MNNDSPTRLLCVDANADDVASLVEALSKAAPARQWDVRRVDDPAAFADALETPVDIVLLDCHIPALPACEALRMLGRLQAPPPLVAVTHAIGEQAAVELLRDGARDYVTKDRLATLAPVIERVLADHVRARHQARRGADLAAAHARLREISARLVAEHERERGGLSRELHDCLGQALAAMVIHLHASRRLEDPAKAHAHTDLAIGMAQGVIDHLKSLSSSLWPAQLDLLGLSTTLETVVREVAAPAGVAFSVVTRGPQDGNLREKGSLVVRAAREAVRRAVAEAGTRAVRVRLRFLPEHRVGLLVEATGGHGSPGPAEALGPLQACCEAAGGSLRVRACGQGRVITRAML